MSRFKHVLAGLAVVTALLVAPLTAAAPQAQAAGSTTDVISCISCWS